MLKSSHQGRLKDSIGWVFLGQRGETAIALQYCCTIPNAEGPGMPVQLCVQGEKGNASSDFGRVLRSPYPVISYEIEP